MDTFNTPLIVSSKRPLSPQASLKSVKVPRVGPLSVKDCDHLTNVLLSKAGFDPSSLNASDAHAVLSAEYSPVLAQLLLNPTNSIEQKFKNTDAAVPVTALADDASDLTQSSDDEAVVPAFIPLPPVSSPAKLAKSEVSVPDAVIQNNIKNQEKEEAKDEDKPEIAKAAYKSETEIAISRIFDLGKVNGVVDPSIPADAPYSGPPVVAMSGFGELGRYGNQVLQYIFMRCLAERHGAEVQVPAWVGASLFGLRDRAVQRAHPAAVEFRGTRANSTFTTDFIDYVKASNQGTAVPELHPDVLVPGREDSSATGPEATGPCNVDVWGWFQWHTAHFAPYKALIQETFEPVPALQAELGAQFDRGVRFRGGRRRTVVALHLRLGDYKNIAASSFGYVAPTAWYLEWLCAVWPTLDDPVLFVASDDITAVLKDFAAYDPLTADSAGLAMPADMKALKAGFFPDWFALTQCDVAAISNSTFSFSACMMNRQPGAQFYRAHYQGDMRRIDPWDADPIVHRDMGDAGFGVQSAIETLRIVYNTQGSTALAKNLLYELPYYGLRSVVMKAVLWRQSRAQKALPVA